MRGKNLEERVKHTTEGRQAGRDGESAYFAQHFDFEGAFGWPNSIYRTRPGRLSSSTTSFSCKAHRARGAASESQLRSTKGIICRRRFFLRIIMP